MHSKGAIASGLVGAILAHHVIDAVKHPLDDSKAPQPMVVMVASSTTASSGQVIINAISDERMVAPPLGNIGPFVLR